MKTIYQHIFAMVVLIYIFQSNIHNAASKYFSIMSCLVPFGMNVLLSPSIYWTHLDDGDNDEDNGQINLLRSKILTEAGIHVKQKYILKFLLLVFTTKQHKEKNVAWEEQVIKEMWFYSQNLGVPHFGSKQPGILTIFLC